MRAARSTIPVVAALLMVLSAVNVALADGRGPGDQAEESFAYWTADRIAAATPRDLVIDHRGLAYLRSADGGLNPYGHAVAAEARTLQSTPIAGAKLAPRVGDSGYLADPYIDAMSPDNETIGASHTFTAQVTSASGVKQITAYVALASSSSYQRFHMSYTSSDADTQTWQLNLSGFSDENWKWYIDVKDNAPRGGNRTTSPVVPFSVDTSGSGSGGNGTVTNVHWTDGGAVQTAAGRIIFSMPDGDYVCSGTAATDGTTGRSIVLTAAHCVYDDLANVFSSNAIFIPNQDGGDDRTDFDCTNDPVGCWSMDHGVVDLNWTTRTFPDNKGWDYAFYVVSDTGAHSGTGGTDALDIAAGTLTIDFSTPTTGATATALGYSYSYDPNFMYCQETMATNGSANYWLDSCDLSGGASGGPWLQPLDGGNGPIISVNSWGYTTRSGIAGPKLHGTSASTLFDVASFSDLTSSSRGIVVDPTNPPTSSTTTTTSSSTTTTTSTPLDPDGITLEVDNFKYRGEKRAVLTWAGAAEGNIDIIRDGSIVGTTASIDGHYEDWTGLKGGAFNTWQVCEVAEPIHCSVKVTVGW